MEIFTRLFLNINLIKKTKNNFVLTDTNIPKKTVVIQVKVIDIVKSVWRKDECNIIKIGGKNEDVKSSLNKYKAQVGRKNCVR